MTHNTRKQSLAIVLAAIMAMSVIGFAGVASAEATEVNDFSADGDFSAGQDEVIQTVELTKVQYNGEETLTIENNTFTDGDVIEDVEDSGTTVHGEEDPADIDTEVNDDGDIEIYQDGTDSLDVQVDVTLNLSEDEYTFGDVSKKTVEYTVDADNGSIDPSTTFDILPPQPEVNDAEATAADEIEIEFDENVNVKELNEDNVVSALTLDDDATAQDADVDEFIEVTGDNTVVVGLDGFIETDDFEEGELEDALDYDGIEYGAPIEHNDNDAVSALDFEDQNVSDDGVAPLASSAEVDPDDPNQYIVTFSEEIGITSGESETDVGAAFDSDEYPFDEGDTAVGTTTVTLNFSEYQNAPVEADEDLDEDLNSTELDDVLNSTNEVGAEDLEDLNVTNTVNPEIDSAEVTAEDPDEITISFDSDISVDTVNVDSDTFDLGTDEADIDAFVESGGSDEVTMSLDDTIASGDDFEDDDGVSYTGGAEIQSDSNTPQDAEGEDVTVSNDVAPTFESAEVTRDEPGEIRVTFTEDIEADGNEDSIATERFSLSGDRSSDAQIHQGEVDGDTFVLNITDESDVTTDFLYEPGDIPEIELSDNEDNENITAADSGPAAQNFGAEEVDNNIVIDTAEVTYDPDPTSSPDGTYNLEVTFVEDIDQDGTDSQIANAFDLPNADQVEIEGDEVDVEVGDDSVTLIGIEDPESDGLNTSIEQVTDGLDLEYDGSGEAEPLEFDGAEAVPDIPGPEENYYPAKSDLAPVIDEEPLSVTDEGELVVPFSEDVTVDHSPSVAANAFSLTDSDGDPVEIASVDQSDTSSYEVRLEFVGTVDVDQDLDELTYQDATEAIVSDESLSGQSATEVPAAAEPLADPGVNVENRLDGPPEDGTITLESAVVDDVAVNNDDDHSTGEMVLHFSDDVSASDFGDDADGVTFDSNNNALDVDITAINDVEGGYDNVPGNVVLAEFESGSSSLSSTITGDTSDEDLNDAEISIDASGSDVDETKISDDTSTEDISNEIADGLDTVDETDINVELLGVQEDAKDDFEVEVSGLADDEGNQFLNESLTVEIDGYADQHISQAEIEVQSRFDGNASTEPVSIASGSFDSPTVGDTVDINVSGAEVSDADDVTYVHEAVLTSTDSYELTSQPMPGEIETGEDIEDVTYWEANSSDFETYDVEDQVAAVHHGLWIDSEEAGAEYGFVFDEDRDTRTNIGTLNLEEGWHVVGSNYNITQNSDIEVQDDLSISGDVNSTDVAVQRADLPGTTLDGDAAIEQYEGYYVFLHEDENRPIVLPEFDGSIE